MVKLNRKGQVWFVDFMVGVLIFVFMVTIYFSYVNTSEYSDDTIMPSLIADSKKVSSVLVTRGYPLDWSLSNITQVGLTDGANRIDFDKLESFNSLSYNSRKEYIHTTKNYYFYLEYINGTRFNILGDQGNTSNYLVQSSRYVIYNNSIVKMGLYLHQI